MRKSFLWLALAASLLTFSCQKVVEDPQEPEIIEEPGTPETPDTPTPPGPQLVNLTITASPETGAAGTRTVLVNGSSVHWLPAEEIAVFSAGEKAKFTSSNTARAADAQFSGVISLIPEPDDETYVWALYPYDENATLSNDAITTTLPSAQTGAAGTFADDLVISAGRALSPFVGPDGTAETGLTLNGTTLGWFVMDEDAGYGTTAGAGENPAGETPKPTAAVSMSFLNVCSGFRFTVDRSDIKSVTLTARGGEPLAGIFTFGFGGDGNPVVTSVSSPSSSVTLTAPGGGAFVPGESYYFITLPVTFSQGVTFDFRTGSYIGTRTISSSFSLNRSQFSYKEHLDAPVTFEPDPDAPAAGDFDYATHSVVFDEEFRAVWVATVKKIDLPTATGAEAQQQEMIDLFTDMKRMGFNAIVYQVNPMADAFWDSEILPWSEYLTGTQGRHPGYDPLQLAIDTAHSLGMELHAWFNPLRIGPDDMDRSADHPMFAHPDWVGIYNHSYYWNPGIAAVRTFVANIMKEVVLNYDVDGTHIDDYFYPSGLQSNADTWDDSAQYDAYVEGGGTKSLYNWRVYNIDQLVKKYQSVTHAAKANVVFGAAPGGTEAYAHSLYCYPTHWLRDGTVDYISPQIYWDHKRTDSANFDTVLNMWLGYARNENCPLMPGLAPYMVYEAGTNYYFYHHPEEMLYQVQDLRSHNLPGCIWFRARFCQKPLLTDYIPQNVYPEEVLTPTITLNPVTLQAPVVTVTGSTLSWTEVQGADNYVVLQLTRQSATSTKWDAAIVHSGTGRTFTGSAGKYYIVIARSGAKKSNYDKVIYLPN